jgi:hypothetical protein
VQGEIKKRLELTEKRRRSWLAVAARRSQIGQPSGDFNLGFRGERVRRRGGLYGGGLAWTRGQGLYRIGDCRRDLPSA